MDRSELIIEYWMKLWIEKKLPEGITTYGEWRRFLEYWLERPILDYNEALTLFKIGRI